jgi:peptide/nickel transport system substrate-binding protein
MERRGRRKVRAPARRPSIVARNTSTITVSTDVGSGVQLKHCATIESPGIAGTRVEHSPPDISDRAASGQPESFLDRVLVPGTALTRRSFVRGVTVAGGLLAVPGLAGCLGGDGDTTTGAGGTPAVEGGKRGGTLTAGLGGGSSTDTLDAHVAFSLTDTARLPNLYDAVTYRNSEFGLENELAEEIESDTTGKVWTVRLRDGVEFHNGKTLSADDLIFSVRRILDPKTASTASTVLGFIDPNGLTKVDKRTVRFTLPQPFAVFRERFAIPDGGVVSEAFDPKKPIGTGPFQFQSFKPGVESVFVRNPNYWREGEPYLDELVIRNITDDSARVNALLSGEIDAIYPTPLAQLPVIRSNGDLSVVVSETGNLRHIIMRTDEGPFKDVRVRQAMRLLVDRQAIVDQALAGEGVVANDLYAPFDPCFASDIPQREQDVEEAMSLLKKAGAEDLQAEFAVAPVEVGLVETAQVFAEQAKAAGVTITVRKLDPDQLFANYLNWPLSIDFFFTAPYFTYPPYIDLPDGPFNSTHFDDPEFNKLYAQGVAEVDEDKRCDIAHQMQEISHDQSGNIIWGYANAIDSFSNKLTGFVPDKQGFGLRSFRFRFISYVNPDST